MWAQLENEEYIHLESFTGTNPSWQQTVIDLTPFVGQSIRLNFQLLSDATDTADGWYIDDVVVFSPDFMTLEPPPPPPSAAGKSCPRVIPERDWDHLRLGV